MTPHKHLWETIDLDAGGYHICKKCKLGSEYEQPATPCPVSDAEHHAAAWLGPFGLYRSRAEAELDGAQQPTPVSLDELLYHAQRYLLITRHLGMGFKPPGCKKVTRTPESTDSALDALCTYLKEQNNAQPS